MTNTFGKIIFAFIIFVSAVFFGLAAKAGDRCDTDWYPEWKADVHARNPSSPLMENYLSETQLAEFVSAYNASPPKSNKQPANVAVWVHAAMVKAHIEKRLMPDQSAPVALVVWIDSKGCLTETEVIPLFVMEKILQGVPFNGPSRESSF